MDSLYERLKNYQAKDIYPMHMPGHKRNTDLCSMPNPYSMDITEIDDFDDLHEAEEIIKESMERAARLYHSKRTFYLVNGSTVGLLAAVAAATNKGDQVLVARNCHKAVYNAIYLNELKPIYLYPEFIEEYGFCGGIQPDQVKKALFHNENIKLIIITSPTYEGIISDISTIAQLAHEKNIPILVDEAHGAHLGFSKSFPSSAIQHGADIVIHSVHKTMPAFTQTALLHSNGELIDNNRIQKFLSIYQTSSPSYLLMASIDQCMNIVEEQGEVLFKEYVDRLDWFYEEVKKLEVLQIFTKEQLLVEKKLYGFDWDPSKIVISVKNTSMTGSEMGHILLKKHGIQVELVSKDYVLAMTSICDTWKGLIRLVNALFSIDTELTTMTGVRNQIKNRNIYHINHLPIRMNCYEADRKECEVILLEQSVGRISTEFIYLYPPGIPIVVPGEEITLELLESMREYKEAGLVFKGRHSGGEEKSLTVVKRE